VCKARHRGKIADALTGPHLATRLGPPTHHRLPLIPLPPGFRQG
jgi:hypothetical protein